MSVLQVELNLFQSKNFTTKKNFVCAPTTQTIGVVSVLNRNTEFILDSIPSNTIGVRILDITNNLSTVQSPYILQLHFERIK